MHPVGPVPARPDAGLGPVAGALLYVFLEFWLGGVTERWQFFLGLILLGVVLFARGGLVGLVAGKPRHG